MFDCKREELQIVFSAWCGECCVEGTFTSKKDLMQYVGRLTHGPSLRDSCISKVEYSARSGQLVTMGSTPVARTRKVFSKHA